MRKTQSVPESVNSLTVSERVGAALSLLRLECPGRISVAEICRRADVSRANLYVNHRQLVAEILRRPVAVEGVRSPPKPAKERANDSSHSSASSREKALLCVCLELQAEIQHLRALQLAAKSSRVRSSPRQKARRTRESAGDNA
jgi:hypothetical protein